MKKSESFLNYLIDLNQEKKIMAKFDKSSEGLAAVVIMLSVFYFGYHLLRFNVVNTDNGKAYQCNSCQAWFYFQDQAPHETSKGYYCSGCQEGLRECSFCHEKFDPEDLFVLDMAGLLGDVEACKECIDSYHNF